MYKNNKKSFQESLGYLLIPLGFLIVSSCEYPLTMNEMSEEMEEIKKESCMESDFFINTQYFETNAQIGPPFPLIRHSFCRFDFQGRDMVSYGFEFSDAHKTPHAKFTLEFTEFTKTDQGNTAIYIRSTFHPLTDFAKKNALGKWLNCRNDIRKGREFVIDHCLEVNKSVIDKIDMDDSRFPCGINTGPDYVSNHMGDDVPSDIYTGKRHSLVSGLNIGDEHNFITNDNPGYEGVFIPSIFSPNISLLKTIPDCGSM